MKLHIAIDDTYGPAGKTDSKYVTGDRRTHVAVVFDDADVDDIRRQAKDSLAYMAELLPNAPAEFHFVDIYNRKPPWNDLPERANLGVFAAFANIYSHYRWKVFLQTVDDHTFHGRPEILEIPFLDGLDVSKRADLSLLWLCIKIRIAFKDKKPPIKLLVDQGECTPGTSFGDQVFGDWGTKFSGQYSSSTDEPLIQIADFMAYVINRSTYLATKNVRTEIDNWFLNLIGEMNINCDDLKRHEASEDFSVSDFDDWHKIDRVQKGLE